MSSPSAPEPTGSEIAIVGIGLHVPGATGPSEFWHNLRDGVEALCRYSDEELAAAGVRPELIRNPRYVKAGGPLQDMEHFDAEFFGFSPKEAAILDPQHRHFYECAWAALEDAGQVPERFDGSIGVFAGCGMNSYFVFNVLSNPDLVDSVGLFLLRHTGNDKDFLATRTSYLFDLQGPSVSVQTACSTSLVATHLACQSLLSGECDLALAGGVTIEVPHRHGYVYREGEILSPDGHCHAFDHRSKGTVLASGCAVVALRRLEDAVASGDPIYAVIRASAVNNDGSRKAGYLAPSVDGQAAAASEALALAGLNGDDVDYIECHGTGTAVGDPIEITALTQAFRETTERSGFCGVGSVKSGIGHLDTAAGVAGLIKVSLALQHGEIPPTLSYEQPNPLIDFDASPFYVNDSLRPFPANGRVRRACVNSLGVGGTNAFVIVEQAPEAAPSSEARRPYQLLSLSARSRDALDAACDQLAGHLREHQDVALADVAYTLQVGRRAFDQRRVLACRDTDEAIALLESRDPARVFTHRAPTGERPVAFVFPGGGAQHPRMGIDLYHSEPEYRDWIDRGLELIAATTGRDLRDLLFAEPEQVDEAAAELERIALQLPATFVVEHALTRLWQSFGIEPVAMLGHSMGENMAACLAGVMSFEDALRLVILRGRLMEATARGGMMSINLPAARVEELLGDELDLATINAPELCVVSGTPDALDRLAVRLDADEIEWRRLRIPIAAHSRLLDPMLAEFEAGVRELQLAPPQIPFVSNRTGTWITDAQATDPTYWVEHVRRTVDFARGVDTLLTETDAVLLEVGPGTALTSLVRQSAAFDRDRAALSSMRHPNEAVDDHAFLSTVLGRLWASGVKIDPARVWAGESRRRLHLPTYPFQRQRFWIEPGRAAAGAAAGPEWPTRLEDVGAWFSVPRFEPAPLVDDAAMAPARWLCFVDDTGLGQRVVERLRGAGHEVICVVDSDAYEQLDDDTWALSPEQGQADYAALIHDLVALGRTPDRVVHLWLCTGEERFRPGSSFFHRNQERGFFSLLFLLQALGGEGISAPVHLTVVTSGMQRVADEALPYPEKATVLGPCRVGPRELPNLRTLAVDVRLPERKGLFGSRDRTAAAWQRLTDAVCAELTADRDGETVAWRDGERFVQRLRPRRLPTVDPVGPAGLRERGVYLITGGLGGLGMLFAENLARTVSARLVLVGRSGLPPRDSRSDWIDSHGLNDPTSRRIQKVQQLEAAGAEVLVCAADVTDVEAMGRALATARERFGAIHGVLHTAGLVEDAPLVGKDQSAVERVLSPKLQGTLLLDSLLGGAELDFFVNFSSTSAVLAPPGQVDYVAASAFLDAFAQSRADSRTRVLTIDWGVWREVGLAAAMLGDHPAGDTGDEAEPARHPLFDRRRRDEAGRHELSGAWSTASQWVLDEHRTADGRALLPGTGYLELARAALAEIGEVSPFEVRDLLFFVPLFVADDAIHQVRVRLTPDQQGYRFEVQSHVRLDTSTGGWQTHAQAALHLRAPQAAAPLELADIDARCSGRRIPHTAAGIPSVQAGRLRFGPRWSALREVAFGSEDALATLALDADQAGDCETYGLHPALLDLATGFALELLGQPATETLWVPVGYDRVRVHGPLPPKFHSWVRVRSGGAADETAAFDVVLADPDGRVLVEVERFAVRRTADGDALRQQRLPTVAELELDASAEAAEHLSPAETALRHNIEQGISPGDGWEAFTRVIGADLGPRVVVSSMDLDLLAAQTAEIAQRSDHSQAKFERPALDSDFVAPRDDIERCLCEFWEDLLGVDGVGVRDSFFDLGGHSLIAVRLFARIRKTYDVDYPISLLFEAPTIEQCAARIRESIGAVADATASPAEPRARYTHLVAMHPNQGSDKTPFFLVAGMFGNVLNLRHLANLIGTDRPFYGLQARGLFGDSAPHETFEEMATDYLAEIRTVQPHGPYLLGGFSGGGLAAYEIAQRLLAAGEEIALLVMLDSILPQPPQLTTADKLRIHLQEMRRQGLGYVGRRVRNRIRWEIEKRQQNGAAEPDGRPRSAYRSETIEAAFRRACGRYQLRPYPGPVVLFRPPIDASYDLGPGRVANRDRQLVYPDNCWTPWVGSLEVHEVPGDHDSMVLDPNVRVLANHLLRCIENAEADVQRAAPVSTRRPG